MFPLKEHGTQLTAEVQDRVRLPWWWPWRDISRPGPDLSDVLEGGYPKPWLSILVGSLEHEFYDFPFSWEKSSQLTNSMIFQRGRYTTNQDNVGKTIINHPPNHHK